MAGVPTGDADSLPALLARRAATDPEQPWLFVPSGLDWRWLSWRQMAGRVAQLAAALPAALEAATAGGAGSSLGAAAPAPAAPRVAYPYFPVPPEGSGPEGRPTAAGPAAAPSGFLPLDALVVDLALQAAGCEPVPVEVPGGERLGEGEEAEGAQLHAEARRLGASVLVRPPAGAAAGEPPARASRSGAPDLPPGWTDLRHLDPATWILDRVGGTLPSAQPRSSTGETATGSRPAGPPAEAGFLASHAAPGPTPPADRLHDDPPPVAAQVLVTAVRVTDVLAAARRLAEGSLPSAPRRPEVTVTVPRLAAPGPRLALAWSLVVGAAVVLEPHPAAFAATAAWARPTLLVADPTDPADLARLRHEAESWHADWRTGPLRRLWHHLRGTAPDPRPFGRLHTLVHTGPPPAPDFWHDRGVTLHALTSLFP